MPQKYLNSPGFSKSASNVPSVSSIADFACIEAKLLIELDGGQHLKQVEYDAERSHKLAINGYKVLRFWNDDVLLRTELVLEQVCRELQPHPSPLLQAGEGAKGEST